LRPIFANDVPDLYGEDLNMRVLQHDSAVVQHCGDTQDWLESPEIKFIPKEDLSSNSPDLAPMDFEMNEMFN
jgi:hypothetical protein